MAQFRRRRGAATALPFAPPCPATARHNRHAAWRACAAIRFRSPPGLSLLSLENELRSAMAPPLRARRYACPDHGSLLASISPPADSPNATLTAFTSTSISNGLVI